jgi:hypothetical protein
LSAGSIYSFKINTLSLSLQLRASLLLTGLHEVNGSRGQAAGRRR